MPAHSLRHLQIIHKECSILNSFLTSRETRMSRRLYRNPTSTSGVRPCQTRASSRQRQTPTSVQCVYLRTGAWKWVTEKYGTLVAKNKKCAEKGYVLCRLLYNETDRLKRQNKRTPELQKNINHDCHVDWNGCKDAIAFLNNVDEQL